MKNDTILIRIDHFLNHEEARSFQELELIGYKVEIDYESKPPKKGTGGFLWYGISIVVPSLIAAGFFNELGKDVYKATKKTLLTAYQKFQDRRQGKGMFTVDIFWNNDVLARFYFSDLKDHDFLQSLGKIREILDKKLIKEEEGNMYYFKYSSQLESWETDEDGG